jgi:hypothetical protein
MLTRDEVVQLIIYLVVATALLLASRARGDTFKVGGRAASAVVIQSGLILSGPPGSSAAGGFLKGVGYPLIP